MQAARGDSLCCTISLNLWGSDRKVTPIVVVVGHNNEPSASSVVKPWPSLIMLDIKYILLAIAQQAWMNKSMMEIFFFSL